MPCPELTSVDGHISEAADARISTADDGLQRGDGVFEVIRLYAGRPFALAEHLDRLERSAAAIELEVDRASFEPEIDALLERFGGHEGQLRLIATRGGRRLAFTENLPEIPATIALATVAYQPTIILTGVKSLSYAANMQSTRLAKARGADEALLVRPDGIVLEAPTSTLFWASGGALKTPSIETGILDSITRRRLIAELDVEEGEYPLADVLGADEAFLASTTREVHPITAIDDARYDAPGGLTRQATEAFAAVLQRELSEAAKG
jgi:branched-chain amino acid aminotransferase